MIVLFVLTATLLVSANLCLATDPLAQEYGELVFVSLVSVNEYKISEPKLNHIFITIYR